ncbi:MAG TPA: glycosyltransferase family 4 protein [Methylomirabilota bacterium]|nr:glycosyltransferase family 4 protein [Methylomirabilota bacterium]
MSLLVLVPAPPAPGTGGGSLRMLQMLRFLGARFDVDVVGPAQRGAAEAEQALRGACRSVEWVRPAAAPSRLRWSPYERDPALARVVARRLADGGYAAVQAEKPAMLPYVPRHGGVPLVLDTWAFGLAGAVRALRHERGATRRALNLVRLARFAAFDARWPATYCILVVSEIDRERCARAWPRRRALVVPNGVDCAAVRPAAGPPDGPPLLMFSGDMSFAPNVEAAVTLATRIFPAVRARHPGVQLRLVGRAPAPRVRALAGAGVAVTGEVADMTAQLQAATVYVAPHDTGAGTRTKLLEALAAGLPIVTTSVGIEGIEAIPENEVLIADDAPAAVAAIVRLLDAPHERRRLGAAARRLAERRYDWAACLEPLGGLYEALMPARVR